MKFTNEERARIRAWLEKDPNSEDTSKTLVLEREGTSQGPTSLARVTQYFGGTDWKVRIAYEEGTNYPVLMSSPIPGGQDSKKQAKTKYPMVPKLPAPQVAPKKTGNMSTFNQAMGAILDDMKVSMKAQLSQPSVWPLPLYTPKPKLKANGLPQGAYKKAVQGTKALYGPIDTLYVMPGVTFPDSFYYSDLEYRSVPKGYHWYKASGLQDLWTLAKK